MISVRWRAFVSIAFIFVLSSTLLYAASALLVQSQFGKIETNDTQQNTARAVDALNNRVDDLAVKSSDWANWDDAYAYVVDHNAAFVDSNLQNGSIANLGINFMLFYDAKHQLVRAKGIDDYDANLNVPAQLLAYFGPTSSLLTNKEDEIHKGFLTIDDQPLYFAARPILTSNATGPVHGTLVFAEYLTPGGIAKLADVTHLPLQFFAVHAAVTSDVAAVRSQLSSKVVTVERLNDNQIAGYRLIDDVTGKPVLIARVLLPRSAYNEAQRSVTYFLIVIGFATLLSMALAMYISNQVLVRDQVIRLKDEFFSIASHELRTPLTAIRGNARLLQEHYDNKGDRAFRELTTDIAESAMRLIRLVNNFLDAARFEKGQVSLSPAAIALQDVGAAVVKEVQGIARDKQLYIRSEIPQDLPLAYADRDRVMQIIYNLIGNAAKFTEHGGVTVSAEVVGEMAKVCVTDTGRGISPEGQKLLFHKFQQVEASDSKTGSGLGLYIAKMLVELMGGKITLERSQENVGTTLSFTLPLANHDQIAAAADKTA